MVQNAIIKILHCVSDEKFIDGVVTMFDNIPNIKSEYVIVSDEQQKEFKYIKSSKVKTINHDEFEKRCIINADYDILYLHSLGCVSPLLISQIHRDIKVVWSSWGYDIYQYKFPQRAIAKLKCHHRLSLPIKLRLTRLYITIRTTLGEVLKHKLVNYTIFNRAIERVDYFAAVLDPEYDLVCKDKHFRAKSVFFKYLSRREDAPFPDLTKKANGVIQIGHSGNMLLNHVYIMRLMHRRGIKVQQVYSPLSYGCGLEYRDWVIKNGEKYFGHKFNPLLKFLPFDEYQAITNSISALIIGADRQIALGNITIAMEVGTKVFLPKDSVTYRYLKTEGLKIYSIEDDLTQDEIDTPMSLNDVIKNRTWVTAYRNYDENVAKINDSIQMIMANK